jgi:hypothetical protein
VKYSIHTSDKQIHKLNDKKCFGVKMFQGLDQTPFECAEEPRSPKGLFYGGAGSRAMSTGDPSLQEQSVASTVWKKRKTG